MADPYQSLTGTRVGKFVVQNLGLPDPTPLNRYRPGDPVLSGSFLVGGSGSLRQPVVAAIAAAGAEPVTAIEDDTRYAGLVFDASGIESGEQLIAIRDFFAPAMRSLNRCPHLVVLGSTPSHAGSGSAHIAQRALEGFTRSLGKEVGRGGTVSLVYVAPGAEDRFASTLTFLLSPKSAYLSGQVVRVGADLDKADGAATEPDRPLDGKVALVTGAARGIGASIARTLHRDGATVIGLDVPRAGSRLQELMAELDGDSVLLDITAVDAPQRVTRAVEERHGGIDVVVHNAGITRDKRLANMSAYRWTSVIDVNLIAPHRLSAELLERGLIRRNGRIIGVASIAGIAGNAAQTNYATSKAGVIGLVDALTPLAAERQVTVNAVAPGFIESQMTARMPVVLREVGRRMNSMSQAGQPIDVAETVAWLADPASYGVTGNVVRVCGQSLLGA